MSYDFVAYDSINNIPTMDYLGLRQVKNVEDDSNQGFTHFNGDHFLAAIQPETMHLHRVDYQEVATDLATDDTSRDEKENSTVDGIDLINLQPSDLLAAPDLWSHTILDDLLAQKDFNLDDFIQVNATEKGMKKRPGRKRTRRRNSTTTEAVTPKVRQRRPKLVKITHNDGLTVFNCPECNAAFVEKELLERHLAVHKLDRRFICEVCGVAMKRKEHIERHKLGHKDERPFVCNVCHKSFKRKEHHDIHYVIHSGEKSIICQECGKGFYRRDHLTTHLKSHVRRKLRKQRREEKLKEKRATPRILKSMTRRRNKCDFLIQVLSSESSQVSETPAIIAAELVPEPVIKSEVDVEYNLTPLTLSPTTPTTLPPFNEISSRIRLHKTFQETEIHPMSY